MISLYPHQQELVANAREAFGRHKRVLLQSVTGGGKSVMASSIIHSAMKKGRKSLFIVPRVDLITQMSNTFDSFHIPHSYIAAGLKYQDAPNHIASLQTFVKKMNGGYMPDFVVHDEVHWGGEMNNKIVEWTKANNIPLLGLSATPARADNYGMGDWFDVMVLGRSVRWHIDNKFLSEYAIIQPDMKRKAQTGDHVVQWLKYAEDRKTICYCQDVQHSQQVSADFNAAGIPAAHMDAETPDDIRRLIISDFASGKLKIITNVFLFQMGFDLAAQVGRKVNVRCVLDLQKTGSLTAQMQKWGRGLRYDESGHAVIIDLAGNSLDDAHGLPCEERFWELDKLDQHKKDVERRERILQLIRCHSCHRPTKLGSPTCPNCGARLTFDTNRIKIVNGVLRQITPEELAQRKQEKIESRQAYFKTLDRDKIKEDLMKEAKEKGYKIGWVFAKMKARGLT